MKKIFVKVSMAILVLGISSTSFGQVSSKVLNWYNGGGVGMKTEKAYKRLKNHTSSPVIVAIIDSGMDIEHEDLQGKIWVNTKEIPNNGIDDDGNGYIDDIHGWNFLGNANGENANNARLEKTRIVARYRDKFDNMTESQVDATEMEVYKMYQQAKKEINEDRAKYTAYMGQMDQLKMIIAMVPKMVEKELGKANYTVKDLKKWKPKTDELKQMQGLALAIASGELTLDVIKEQEDHLRDMLEYNLNIDFDDRAIIGDDLYTATDNNYGNGDVEGPDALHGTHVGGIVGAIRGNNKGGDGVAENVQLMSVRAVPNGDEFDKDIANAIIYAVNNGASVINMSFGKSFSPDAKRVYDALKYADEKGVLLIHAAGNDNKDVDLEPNFPTSKYSFQTTKLDHYLTIGASTRVKKNLLPADFSNYGQTSVDIFAPGHEIYNSVPQSEYKLLQGTSMAAPMVAGAAAMLKSYFPEMSMKEIKEILLETGKSFKTKKQILPGTDQKVEFGTLSVTGKIIDLDAAVKACIKIQKGNQKK